MSENKYESRVRQRAEEFAIESMGPAWGLSTERAREIEMDRCRPLARLSVQREAEAVEEALEFLHQSIYSSELGKKHCARYLQSLGLVPENEPDQEAGKV